MREGIKLPEGWVNDVIGNYVELSQGLAINKKTDYVLTEDVNIGLPLLKINNLINNTSDTAIILESLNHYFSCEIDLQ